MRPSVIFSFTCLSLNLSNALPVLREDNPLRPRAKYSVVAVDGSNGGPQVTEDDAGPAATTTITLVQTVDRSVTVTAHADCSQAKATTSTSTTTVFSQGPERTLEITVTKYLASITTPSPKKNIPVVNVAGTVSSPQPGFETTATSTAGTGKDCSTSTRVWAATSTASVTDATSNRSPAGSGQPSYSPTLWQSDQSLPTTVELSTSTSPTSTSKGFDDGLWHSRYSPWNATLTSVSRFSTSTSTILPLKLR